MATPSSTERDSLIAWSRQVAEAIQNRGDGAAGEGIGHAIEALLAERFVLAVLGKAKRGKSTLLNALLGRQDDTAAPIDKLPASSAISRFRWSNAEHATVIFRDGGREPIDYRRIREFVTEEHNRENHKGVNIVEIEGPFPGLAHDLELVDTPGAASLHEHHDALLHAFIPQADAVIFLVTARMPLDQDELELLRQVKAADIRKVFFAINRTDECDDRDLQDAISHNMQLLSRIGIQVQCMHRLSARRAFLGDLAGSGVAALIKEIAAFLAAGKGRMLADRFASRIRAAAEPISQSLHVQLAGREKSARQLELELAELRDRKRTIGSERQFAEREFTLAWSRAVDAYEQKLRDAKRDVSATVLSRIHDASAFEVSSLARQLPTLLTQTMEQSLGPAASQFEEAARSACERLQASCPAIQVSEAGRVVVHTREGHSALAGAVGGAAMAAAGAGIATAGAAAAASIAAANAAAAAATVTVTAPSAVSGLLTLFGLDGLASLATGTATVAAPTAMTATPLWVALAGPVGWTLAGIGLFAVPFSWRLSKLKLKEKIAQASEEQIASIFARLQTERLRTIRELGRQITEEMRLRLDRQLDQIESAMITARDRRPGDAEVAQLADLASRLRRLLDTGTRPEASTDATGNT